ncbi:disulfide bond formation protein B, partial [Blastomonas sp.]
RCDAPQWTLGGISMAGYNFILSLAGAASIFLLIRRRKTGSIAA